MYARRIRAFASIMLRDFASQPSVNSSNQALAILVSAPNAVGNSAPVCHKNSLTVGYGSNQPISIVESRISLKKSPINFLVQFVVCQRKAKNKYLSLVTSMLVYMGWSLLALRRHFPG